MNSLTPAFTTFHAPAVLKRLLVAALAVLLLEVLTVLPALAVGSGTWILTGSVNVGGRQRERRRPALPHDDAAPEWAGAHRRRML